MIRKQMVAMLLAGGEGKRLGELTKDLAKPAVYFGGKYRIIDFTLSNCVHSGIDTVGVLTQYQPLELNRYLGIGTPWGLDRRDGGMTILPPYMQKKGGSWYKGTANAIYQNIGFIERYDPEYVLVISGDHIYKMDYSLMLEHHISNKADLTIAGIEVGWEEASRFGLMHIDEQARIIGFEEKPKKPTSNLASMGVYIFNWKQLRQYLIEDELTAHSSNDFGKDVIPSMLKDDLVLSCYKYAGYWKDVGTIDSLWEANMDLIERSPSLDLGDPNWRIYSVNPVQPAQFVSPAAHITTSLITEGCFISGKVHRSILFYGVGVGEQSEIYESVIMPKACIGRNVKIYKAIIGEGAVIEDGAVIGSEHSSEITVIPVGKCIPANYNVMGVE